MWVMVMAIHIITITATKIFVKVRESVLGFPGLSGRPFFLSLIFVIGMIVLILWLTDQYCHIKKSGMIMRINSHV
jgi:hypothetical protein